MRELLLKEFGLLPEFGADRGLKILFADNNGGVVVDNYPIEMSIEVIGATYPIDYSNNWYSDFLASKGGMFTNETFTSYATSLFNGLNNNYLMVTEDNDEATPFWFFFQLKDFSPSIDIKINYVDIILHIPDAITQADLEQFPLVNAGQFVINSPTVEGFDDLNSVSGFVWYTDYDAPTHQYVTSFNVPNKTITHRVIGSSVSCNAFLIGFQHFDAYLRNTNLMGLAINADINGVEKMLIPI